MEQPLGAALHQAPFGSAMKKPIDIGMDALKKPHQIMNFLAKNTGKGMMAAFGKARGVVKPQSTTSMFDDFLDEMYDPNTTKRKIPTKPKGILDFSRFRGTGDEAGRVAGDLSLFDRVKKGVEKIPKPKIDAGMKLSTARNLMKQGVSQSAEFIGSTTSGVARPVASKVGEGLELAIKKTKSMMAWIKELSAKGAGKGSLKIANQKLAGLWSAFAPLIATHGDKMRYVPALMTRFVKYLVPFAATAFVIGETKYDIMKMMSSDMPWLEDPLNMESWAKEAKVHLAVQAQDQAGDAFSANAISGLLPTWLGGDPEAAAKRMEQSMGLYKDAGDIMNENMPGAAFTGKKAQMIGVRVAAAIGEIAGTTGGAATLPLTMASFMAAEATRQQADIGIQSENNYFSSGQFANDFRFVTGQSTQKVTIDGADGSQYTSGAET